MTEQDSAERAVATVPVPTEAAERPELRSEPPTATEPGHDQTPHGHRHPIARMLARRLIVGVLSIVVVAFIVYFATLVLPGDAAQAILGKQATPDRLALLRRQLHLDQSAWSGFVQWVGNAFQGDFGTSLTNSQSVTGLMAPRIMNTAVLVVITAVLSSVIGVGLGALAAERRDGVADQTMSVVALVASALPEFVVGIFVVIVLATKLRWFPAVSLLPPGDTIWGNPSAMVLPVITLVIVVTPYVFRMSRASILEALQSDYVELARLKGASSRRLLLRHALPNALAPTVQVIGLNTLYLAGGIVLVETVFQYPGIGLALVNAVNDRDVPTIQFIVLVLSVFYIVLNILTDLAVLLLTPRRRLAR